jgi:hypothetical protein
MQGRLTVGPAPVAPSPPGIPSPEALPAGYAFRVAAYVDEQITPLRGGPVRSSQPPEIKREETLGTPPYEMAGPRTSYSFTWTDALGQTHDVDLVDPKEPTP